MLWSAVTSKTNGIISANQKGEILKHDSRLLVLGIKHHGTAPIVWMSLVGNIKFQMEFGKAFKVE